MPTDLSRTPAARADAYEAEAEPSLFWQRVEDLGAIALLLVTGAGILLAFASIMAAGVP